MSKAFSQHFAEHKLYLKRVFSNPLKLGSVVPTSSITAKFIAQHIPKDDKYILELGAGTGALTAGMLKAGIPLDKLICVEIDPAFCAFLETKFPGLKVVCADAAMLRDILPAEILDNISTVVSAIPLLTLPKDVTDALLKAIVEIIGDKGRYLQVSYSPFSPVPWKKFSLKHKRYGTIFKNLPPISIFGYEKA